MTRFAMFCIGLLPLLAIDTAGAETLLVVRESSGTVDFVDPGSSLRLASVKVGDSPREISVAADGLHAAVLNHGRPDRPEASISIVDLQQPHELRRISLPRDFQPSGLAWVAPDRVVTAVNDSGSSLTIDTTAGRIVGESAAGERPAGGSEPPRLATSTTASTPVMPRAVCHACTKP